MNTQMPQSAKTIKEVMAYYENLPEPSVIHVYTLGEDVRTQGWKTRDKVVEDRIEERVKNLAPLIKVAGNMLSEEGLIKNSGKLIEKVKAKIRDILRHPKDARHSKLRVDNDRLIEVLQQLFMLKSQY